MERVRSSDGTEIVFDRSGDGPPLVLVVGAFSDRTWGKALGNGLREAFTVYEYDRRGRGDSGNTPPYAVGREVEDLAALIEVAGDPAFVFGQSSGGALALEAAASAVPICALVVHEPPYVDGPTSAFAERLDALVGEGRCSEAAAAFLELLGTPPTVIAEMKAGPHWAHLEVFAPTLSHEIRLCNNGVVPTGRLAKVSAPTLALAGAISPSWAGEGARAIADAVSSGQARMLAGQGHKVADDVLISVLKEFFA
jgi:pimeloyl-ACP methyl ester carboxylesterase